MKYHTTTKESVKFCANFCTHWWNINKSHRGIFVFTCISYDTISLYMVDGFPVSTKLSTDNIQLKSFSVSEVSE